MKILEIAEQDNYLLKILEDDEPFNPRKEMDHFGTMVCFHRRHNLGDEHNFQDSDEFLMDLLTDSFGGDDEKAERFYENAVDKVEAKSLGKRIDWREVDNIILAEISKQHVILPLYLYDHSGITMNTGGFSDPWDSGQVGWIYAAKDEILSEYGGKNLTQQKREKAAQVLEGEVELYDHYLCGDCYGFELYKSGEMIDSCWGFLGGYESIKKDIAAYLPSECRGLVDKLHEPGEPSSLLSALKGAKNTVDQARTHKEQQPRATEVSI